MWLKHEHFVSMCEAPNSATGTAARKFVAGSVSALRETPFVQRSVKRSLLFSRCSTRGAFQEGPLPQPYNPHGPGCFVLKSRDWPQLRRVWWPGDDRDSCAIVHRRLLPLLQAVYELQCKPVQSIRWPRYRAMLRFVRRAARLFAGDNVASGVGPRDVDAAQKLGEHPPRVVGDAQLLREAAPVRKADLQLAAASAADGGEDNRGERRRRLSASVEAQIAPAKVGGVAVGVRDCPASDVRHRKRKHRDVERDKESSRCGAAQPSAVSRRPKVLQRG